MPFTWRHNFAVVFLASVSSLAAAGEVRFTHGPILGRPGSDHMAVWARTSRPAAVHVVYGTDPQKLTEKTASVQSTVDHDLASFVIISGLRPRTKYYYEIVVDGADGAPGGRGTSLA